MDEVFRKLEREILAEISIGGFTFGLSNTLICVWIVAALLVAVCFLLAGNLQVKPGKKQVLVEMLVGFIRNMCRDNIGEHHYGKYVPYLGTLFLFLCMSNLLAVINFIPGVDLYPPTKDINVTAPLAVMSILIVLYSSFRYKGPVGTVKDLFRPVSMMFPFKLMEYVTKPLSLCLRLFGNIVAAFIIMELVYHFAGLFAAPLSAYFDFFDGILQAYIFVFLTCLYIGETVECEI
jgi:F-type H+-transporting ATPase subunit a